MQKQQSQAGISGEYDVGYTNRLLVFYPSLNFITYYIQTMLLTSLPAIASDFGVSIAQVTLVTALYAVSGTALVPVVGKLGDIFGKKKVLVYVLFIYALAVSVTGFSPSLTFMLSARAIQGIGFAIQPLLISLVREQFPKESVPKAQGILSGMSGVGLAVALPLGSLVSNNYGWRTTYFTATPFVALLAIMAYFVVKESPYKRPGIRVDYVGAGLLGSSLAMVVFGLAEGPTWGWVSTPTLSLLTVGMSLVAPLVLYEQVYRRHGGEPILNLRLLAVRNVLTCNLAYFLSLLAMISAFQTYVFRFELPSPAGYGLDIFTAGLSLIPLAASIFIFSPLTGVLVSRVGVKRIAIPGAAVAAVGFLLSAQAATYAQLLGCMFVVGTGLSMVTASVINLLVLTVDPRDLGLASSMNTVFRNLGNSVGAPVTGSILSSFTVSMSVGSTDLLLPSSTAFQYSFYLAAGAFLAVGLVVIFAAEVLSEDVDRQVSESRTTREGRAEAFDTTVPRARKSDC
jgi:MFS family permease